MPKLRTQQKVLSPDELRTKRFLASIEYHKVLLGIRTNEELAYATGFHSRQSLDAYRAKAYENLSATQIRRVVKGLRMDKEILWDWLGY